MISETEELISYGVSPSEVGDIDPEIRDVVLDLNRRGYGTVGSCAGHSRKSHGFISFSDYGDVAELYQEMREGDIGETRFTADEKKEIRGILQEHGLTGIRFRDAGWTWGRGGKRIRSPWTIVRFDPIGRRRGSL